MQEESQSNQENKPEQAGGELSKNSAAEVQPDLHADDDGRNREWEDRGRVNLENVPAGTHTNIERDFEPEQENSGGNKSQQDAPAY